jgi:hypothetical protein
MSLATVLAESGQQGKDLPLQPWAIGLGTFLLLTALLLVTLTFGKDR